MLINISRKEKNMKIIPNENKVNEVHIRTGGCFYCMLGKDYTTVDIDFVVVEPKNIVEFVELKRYFQENCPNSTREAYTKMVFDLIKEWYEPEHEKVVVSGNGVLEAEVSMYF